MKSNILMLASALILFGCGSGSTKLSDDGRKVQIMEGRPFQGCEVMGKVTGETDIGAVEVARNVVRNRTADLNGNFVLIKDEVMNGAHWKVHGLAYKCP